MKKYNLASFLTGFLALILLMGTAPFDVIADDTGTTLTTSNVAPAFDLDPFDYVLTTQLDGALSGGETTITVDSTAGFNADGGTIKIDDEQDITYTGKTATTLTGVSNVSSAHSDNATVYLANDNNNPVNFNGTGYWTAKATDQNTDSYFFTSCFFPTPTIVPQASAAGQCPFSLFWCNSATTASGSEITLDSCSYDIAPNSQGESAEFYGYVCDDRSSDSACSSANSVNANWVGNFRPVVESFTATDTSDGTIEPGDTVRFKATVRDINLEGGTDKINMAICADGATLNTSDLSDPCGASTEICSATDIVITPATGTITFNNVPEDGDTVTIDGITYEFDTGNDGVSGGNTEVDTNGITSGNDTTDEFINAYTSDNTFAIKGPGVYPSVVQIVAVTPGTGGNSVAMTESDPGVDDITLSGATLSSGTTSGTVSATGEVYCDDTQSLTPIPTPGRAYPVEYFVWDEHEYVANFQQNTRLAAPVDEGADTLTVDDSSLFPSSGTIVVGHEQVTYSGKNSGTTLDGLSGTLDMEHSENEPVYIYSDTKYDVDPVTDGDMEAAGTTAWTAGGTGTLAKVADERTGGSGSQSLQLTSTSGDVTAIQSVGDAGQVINVSGWAKAGSGGCAFASFTGAPLIITTAGAWTYFSITGAVSSDLNLGLGCGASSGNTANFDDIEVSYYQYNVENVAPTFNTFTITGDGSGDFNPTAGTTTSFSWSVSYSDNNGDNDVSLTLGGIYDADAADEGNDEGNSNCVTDTGTNTDAQQECYSVGLGICTFSDVGSGTDVNGTINCSVDTHFNIAPSSNWVAWQIMQDGGGNQDSDNSQTLNTLTHTVAELLALDIRDATDGTTNTDLQYGTLAPGGDTGTLSEVFYIANYGNVALDTQISGTDMCNNWGTPYTVCSGDSFSASQQEYSTTASTNYGSGNSVNTSADCINNDVPVRGLNTDFAGNDPIYFGIQLPESVASGTYTGQNTVTAASATNSCGS